VSWLAIRGKAIRDPDIAAEVERVVRHALRPRPLRRIQSRAVRNLARAGILVAAGALIWAIGLLLGGWGNRRWLEPVALTPLLVRVNWWPLHRYRRTAIANGWDFKKG